MVLVSAGDADCRGTLVDPKLACPGSSYLTTTHGGYTLLLSNNLSSTRKSSSGPGAQSGSLRVSPTGNPKWSRRSNIGLEATHLTSHETAGMLRKPDRQSLRLHVCLPQRRCIAFAACGIRFPRGCCRSNRECDRYRRRLVLLVSSDNGITGYGPGCPQDRRYSWLPLYALIATVQLAHLFYWTNARMRAPLTPALSLFAAVSVMPWRRPHSRAKQE